MLVLQDIIILEEKVEIGEASQEELDFARDTLEELNS